jgi:RNA polymerase sigma-70 factor (ECF subfamily)
MLELVTSDFEKDTDQDEIIPASLNDLLGRVADGDQVAFGQLYDQTSGRVFGLVRRLLKDSAQSEEVTQEIFLEVWQNSKRYDPNKGSAATWILTMAHRRAVDRIRSSEYDSVSESVEIRVEHERVGQALQRLTELQRQAVTLAYYGGYSHSEVAEMLKVPIGTVKTRLRDGMIRLRDELGVAS